MQKWTSVADGVEVLRLWRFVARRRGEPEIAVLRFSAKAYALFRKDPKGFFNKHHIYPKPVRVVKPTPPKKKPGGSVYAIARHWPSSLVKVNTLP